MLQDLAKVAASGMSDLSVLDLVDCAVGCADLSFFPGDEWMDAHETAANARMAELTARQFGLLKQAYGQLDLLYQELAGTGRTWDMWTMSKQIIYEDLLIMFRCIGVLVSNVHISICIRDES
jgi:hypothetical protein